MAELRELHVVVQQNTELVALLVESIRKKNAAAPHANRVVVGFGRRAHNPPKDLFDKYLKKGESKFVARYYAMVEWFDQTCGELFEELDNRGLSKNTIVIYVTDTAGFSRLILVAMHRFQSRPPMKWVFEHQL